MFRTLARVALAALLVAGCATRTSAPVVERTPVPSPPMTTGGPPPAAPSSALPLPPAPPVKDWRPEFYTVKRGDTLYAVALEHGLDYRELAAMNNVENVNVIRVGQVLRVRAPGDAMAAGSGPATAPLTTPPPVTDARPLPPPGGPAARPADRSNSETYKSSPKAIKLPFSEAALAQLQAAASRSESPPVGAAASGAGAVAVAPAVVAPPVSAPPQPQPQPQPTPAPAPAAPVAATTPPSVTDAGDDKVDWGWPVRGRIISGFSETSSLKGIDIAGSAGVPILASAPGRVVYAGSGLRGYGKLVIVKHNKTYLSAYAHLDQIAIREGQNVTRGQELGKMGNTDADQVKLHFEIRQLGKPVDPTRYLPR